VNTKTPGSDPVQALLDPENLASTQDGATNPKLYQALLENGRERGAKMSLAYAGAVTPEEAWRLHSAGAATIVDVRTRPEWEFVGHVEGAPLIEWRAYGAGSPNPQFLETLAAEFDRERPLLFLCRSAARSHSAAEVATRAGFKNAFNILEGFEGGLDAEGHRGSTGWRAAGLPWQQG
jgi:rhodanese-related sulfurtransferase